MSYFLLHHTIALSTWQEQVKITCDTVMYILNVHMTEPPINTKRKTPIS